MNVTSFIVCAGLGTTGTSAIDVFLGSLGYTTAKWTHVTHQPSGEHRPSLIMRPLLHGRYRTKMFQTVDVILDSPAIDFLPWLLDDYPSGAVRLILSTRDHRDWAKRRRQAHPCAAPPFRTWFMPFKQTPCIPTDRIVLEHGYLAWTGYIKELARVRRIPLLELNLFDHTVDWRHELTEFLGKKNPA